MTPVQARDVMLAVFRDAWVAHGQDVTRVLWPDQPGAAPETGAAWARVAIRHANSPMRAFSEAGALYSNTGTLWIQIFTPVGDANAQAYALAHAVVTAYRRAGNEGVTYREPRFREVGVSGAFEQTNVLADFSYDDR